MDAIVLWPARITLRKRWFDFQFAIDRWQLGWDIKGNRIFSILWFFGPFKLSTIPKQFFGHLHPKS